MNILLSTEELIISELGEFIAGLLNRITLCSDPSESPKAASRLYPVPSIDAKLNADWTEYVQPDLKQQFDSANEVVNSDLAAIEQTRKVPPEFTLRIPMVHAESWICSVNQAIVALAANYDVTEKDTEREPVHALFSERELALFQIELYQQLQEHLVHAITLLSPDSDEQ